MSNCNIFGYLFDSSKVIYTIPQYLSYPHIYDLSPFYQSPSSLLPCIAICRALSASANPPAILPLLSRAPVSLALPEYPLSLLALSGAGLRAAGLLAGGAGGFGLPFAGRAGGGGGGAGALLTTCSSRYALGAQPEALLSRREASHQPFISC